MGVSDYQCPEGVFVAPHETQCELYYLCSAGDVPTHLYQCRDDLLYELQYNGCNFKELVDCGNRLPPFTCPSPNGNFPIKEGSCSSRYFVCTNGVHTVEVWHFTFFIMKSYSNTFIKNNRTARVGLLTQPLLHVLQLLVQVSYRHNF